MILNKKGNTFLGFVIGILVAVAFFLINKYIYTFIPLPLC